MSWPPKMKPSMPWPTFTLLGISFILTIISLVSPRFLLHTSGTSNYEEEYQQQQPSLELSEKSNKYATNDKKIKDFPQGHPSKIQRSGYRLSNSENYKEQQRPRYQKQDNSLIHRKISESTEQSNIYTNQYNNEAIASKLEIIELPSLVSNSNPTMDEVTSDITNTLKEENKMNDLPIQRKAIKTNSKEKMSLDKNNTLKNKNKFHKKVETDENIIFLSASMALVLGAISARRLVKKRRFLAGFFENDYSFEDDLAYDLATTVSSVADYGSFASPWIGDMEKFDV